MQPVHSVSRMGVATVLALLLFPTQGITQQLGDSIFSPELHRPAFEAGGGPRVVVDGAHENFHTLSGRFGAFARLLRADGFVVEGHDSEFTTESLRGVGLLVIANALNAVNQSSWTLPTPSAFTLDEVEALRAWVEQGGALLLLADHMPFPGAAADLGAAFGFEFSNGFAMDPSGQGNLTFRQADGSLSRHLITEGMTPGESIDSIAAFTGQAFRSPPAATDLLVMPMGWVSLEPTTAWEFDDDTPRVDVDGWSQGSVLEYGRGRLAVFGEAAMFTAQRTGPDRAPMGMNSPHAHRNPQFVANLVRWLTRVE
jgi:hypothetical protein